MAKDFGNSRFTATSASTNRAKPFTNTVGGDDRRDFLKVTLSTYSSLSATLSKFKGNLRFALLDESGKVLQTGTSSGKKKLITTLLDAGTYLFRLVGKRSGSTRYRLKIDAAIANSAPTLTTNTGLGVNRSGFATLNGSLLKVTDAQQSASELVYTLTGKPIAGQLRLNGSPLEAGGSFTQADIDAGRLSYTSRSSVNQLTQNSLDDGGEGLFAASEEAIAWSTFNTTNYDVNFFDGTSIVPLTDTPVDEYVTDVYGKTVAWYGPGGSDGGADTEIFFYDGSTVRQLTTNTTNDFEPEIFGSNVAWYGRGGSDGGIDEEIFFYNGSSTTQLTANGFSDFAPQISGSNITWYGEGGGDGGSDFEIFFYDGSIVQQLTTNDGSDFTPTIDGSNITWYGEGGSDGGSDFEIFFFNGASTQQLTVNDVSDLGPTLSGSSVAWFGRGGTDGGTDYEIFFYDGSTIRQLTTNITDDSEPIVSAGKIIWFGEGGSDGGSDNEIFFFNGSTIQQLTRNSVNESLPQLKGDLYAWIGRGGSDSGSDFELFYGSYVTSDRFSFTVSDGAGGSTEGSFVFNIT